MSIRKFHRGARDEAGVTIVELIVYVVVAALFLALMASLLATGLRTEAATRDRNTATGKAQLVSESIQTSIRNSIAFQVDGNLLRARVAKGSSGWECRAWALTGGGDMVYETSNSAIPAGSYVGWTVLASGVAGTLDAGSPFDQVGKRLALGYTVTVGDSTVPITGGVTAQAEGTATACW